MRRTSRWTPRGPGAPTAMTTSAAAVVERAMRLRSSMSIEPHCRLTFEVAADVGDHRLVRTAHAFEGGVERARPDRDPVTMTAQTEQEVVAAVAHRVRERPHLSRARSGTAVDLDELLDARNDIAGVVQHRLVGVESQVGEHDETAESHVGSQTLAPAPSRRSMRRCHRARSPRRDGRASVRPHECRPRGRQR